MHQLLTDHGRKRGGLPLGERGSARTGLLLAACFLFGIAVSAFLFYSMSRGARSGANANRGSTPAIQLSDNTRAVLGHLNSPLQIRFHASLDSATVPASLIAFAGRVNQLLAAYQQEAGDKIKLEQFDSPSSANADTAFDDGVPPFNLDRGNPCWLGIALVLEGRKESLPRLLPEWEPALEADLTRAIARLLDAARPVPVPAPVAVSQINTAALQQVQALIPNLAAVSVEQGTQILREAALKEFAAAAQEMETQLKEAEQRLARTPTAGPEADQQTALKHLRQVQRAQAEKLKQIAARSKAQIETLQQLKTAR